MRKSLSCSCEQDNAVGGSNGGWKKIAEMLKRNSEDYFSVIEEISEGRERVVGRLRINAPMAFGEKFYLNQ